jgi:hypothetical protein
MRQVNKIPNSAETSKGVLVFSNADGMLKNENGRLAESAGTGVGFPFANHLNSGEPVHFGYLHGHLAIDGIVLGEQDVGVEIERDHRLWFRIGRRAGRMFADTIEETCRQKKRPRYRIASVGWKQIASCDYFFPNAFFRNFKPFTAMSSRRGSIFRQMAAARAMTFTSVVKDSITMSPL